MKSRLVRGGLLALLVAFVCGCGKEGKSTEGNPGAAPDLVSARDTTKTFLNTLRDQDGSSAYGLLSAGYRGRLSEEERKSKAMRVTLAGGEPVAEWSYGPGKLLDANTRATFDGKVQRADGKQHEFALVLVKDQGGGGWRVDLFTVKK